MFNKGSISLLLLFTVLLSGAFFIFGFYAAKQKNVIKSLNNADQVNLIKETANIVYNDKCNYYGYLFNRDDYLPRYTVKKGDTLGSLAKTYLGETERYTELIELNKERYQNLQFDSFLEIGWVLYIPPSFAFPTKRLAGYSGEVIRESDDFIVIDLYGKSVKYAHPVMQLKKEVKTKYFEKNNFNTGDCVGVLVDSVCIGEVCSLVAVAPEESYKRYFTEPLEMTK